MKKRILSIILVIYFSLFAIILILRFGFGIRVAFCTVGESMLPTMRPGTFSVAKMVPFDDLEVGDVIVYKQREDPIAITSKGTIHFKKVMIEQTDENGVVEMVPGVVAETEAEDPSSYAKSDRSAVYQDKNVKYKIFAIPVVHRITEIREEGEFGDKVLFTKGDNNEAEDHYPVLESGYCGKVIWYMNGLGFFVLGIFITLLVLIVVFAIVVFVEWRRKPKEE